VEKNIKTYRTHMALAWLYGVVMTAFAFIFAMSADRPSGAFVILLFFLVPLLFHFFIARGARERKSWARRASFGIGVLMLFGFPVGTMIGVYLLSNAWGDWPNKHSGMPQPTGGA
jgi:lysylphosphatidylglycerol synthetase-like protein (DUF2156 family)